MSRRTAPDTARNDGAAARPLDGLADLVARLRRAMRRAARAAQSTSQLSVAQLELLTVLDGDRGLRAGDVAATLRMAPNSVSTLAQALEAEGMLRRSVGRDDRRIVELTLTPAGEGAVRTWQADNGRLLDAALGQLDAADLSALTAALPALERLIDRIDEHVDASPRPPDRKG